MRVNGQNLTGATAAESGRAQETEKSSRNQGVQTGTSATQTDKIGDSVEFSSTLGTLARAMSASGSARSSRIQALAAQYQSGNYQPDSAATARGMVSEALLAESQ
jgi:anti-sigma28 factor (negative regulator of flagellin synthesis)